MLPWIIYKNNFFKKKVNIKKLSPTRPPYLPWPHVHAPGRLQDDVFEKKLLSEATGTARSPRPNRAG
jgi:hypothetical protein